MTSDEAVLLAPSGERCSRDRIESPVSRCLASSYYREGRTTPHVRAQAYIVRVAPDLRAHSDMLIQAPPKLTVAPTAFSSR